MSKFSEDSKGVLGIIPPLTRDLLERLITKAVFQKTFHFLMTTSGDDYVKDAAPAKPNENLLRKEMIMMLLSGYIRNKCRIKEVPEDVRDLCMKWVLDPNIMSYEEALDILLNRECCFGIYDFKMEKWRAAFYMKHYQNTKKILIRYATDRSIPPQVLARNDRFCIIKNFPVNYIIVDFYRFYATKQEIGDHSGLSGKKAEEWMKRIKVKYSGDNKLLNCIEYNKKTYNVASNFQ